MKHSFRKEGVIAILQLVDELADLVKSGWSIPFTPYRAVRGADIDQLVDRIRINVPSSIREGEQTLAERDRILSGAKAEAEEIVDEALRRQRELLSERGMLALANREQESILDRGRDEANRRVNEANEYAVVALQELRDHLNSLTEQVDNGIRVMSRQAGVGSAANGQVHSTSRVLGDGASVDATEAAESNVEKLLSDS